MNVGVDGDGPAVDAVAAALSDLDTTVTSAGDFTDLDLAIVAAPVGRSTFDTANEQALETGTPWLAVELGGLGGYALTDVDASVAGFAPGTGCYRCLSARIAANDPDTDEPVDIAPSSARLTGATAGREAARLLAGEESAILGGLIELPHAERRFLPIPGCSVCGDGRDRSLRRTHTDASLDDALARAQLALDERVGLVQSVGEAESFPAPYYLATACDTTEFSDVSAATQAAGVAADWDTAFMKALGESLERYAAGVYREAEFTVTSATELSDAVPPGEFVRPDEGYETPGLDDSLAWVEGTALSSGDVVAVPAEFVHFPPRERRFRPAITTGLGLGNSPVEAVLSGLYEVIERDATMLAWYSTFDPLGLDVADEGFAELAKRARAENLSVTPLLVTQDVDVPVVAVAVHREDDWPRFAVGSAADLDATAAARSALAEALQNWMELRGMGRDGAADESGAIGRYADFPEAARAFVSPTTNVSIGRVGPETPPSETTELDAVIDRVTGAGLDAYAARLTTRDIEQLGFEAVRVLVPSAQPLFTGKPYFGERARTVPESLGFEPRLDREFHPYP